MCQSHGTFRRLQTQDVETRKAEGVVGEDLRPQAEPSFAASPSSWDSYLSSFSGSCFVGEEAGQAILCSLLSLWVGVSACLSINPTSHILFQKKILIGAGEITQWWRTLAILKEDAHSIPGTTAAQLRAAHNSSSRWPDIPFWPLHIYTYDTHLYMHINKNKI